MSSCFFEIVIQSPFYCNFQIILIVILLAFSRLDELNFVNEEGVSFTTKYELR